MSALPAQEMPVLCRACGGPSQVRDGEMRCPYCGQRERLPEERAALIADLERRLVISASASFQAAGTQRALAAIFERPAVLGGFTGTILAVGIAAIAITAVGSIGHWRTAPAALRADLVVSAIVTPVLILTVPASFVAASWVGRWRYRTTVRPFLLARAPRCLGGPVRCRVCGADLAATTAPIVRCRFCGTESVVGPELHRSRASFLERERLEHLARAKGLAPTARRVSSWMGWAMGLAFVGSVVVSIGFLWLVRWSLTPPTRW